MQFPGKLEKQIWENGNKPNFEPNFGLFDPNLGPQKIFFQVLLLLVVRYCSKLSSYAICMKTNEPNLKKWQKPSFGTDFGLFGSNLDPKMFFAGFTSIRC